MKPWIAVSLLTDKQSFQRKQAEAARAAALQAGVDVEVAFAGGSVTTQVQQLMSYVLAPPEKRAAAVVLEPTGADGFERIARSAVQAQVGWITVHSTPAYVEALSRENPRVPVSCVAVDDAQAGVIQARQCLALLPRGGQILLVQGPRGNSAAILRRQGLERELGNSRIRILGELHADWTEEGAEQWVSSWLDTGGVRPDLVLCQNDSMALGADKAFRAGRPAWGKLLLIGCDGLADEGQRFVDQRVMAATVITPATAGKGVELAARSLSGQSIPPSLLLPVESYPHVDALLGKHGA